ncbi:hypothetical protein VOI54_07415 [Tamlana sp. 2201CG12-4]|uniref:hypothetical protein n=1 Tax=Tamlana sp. 2201CG12-4 TaxID=3112582 RepID=UPI002DB6A9E7|nr:hypothetical protein [Tamlana sp. 2201CG12-4]MEC3906842.1 hypothetical protein [Tamlana sp. 2201CG12-4]
MDIDNLIKLTENDLKTEFLFDELGMTWQISFIRMVGGSKFSFDSVEQFYLSLIRVVEMHTDLTYGLSLWQFQVDLNEWINGLKIEKIDISSFENNLKGALDEIEGYKNDWTEGDDPKFNKENIIKPEQIINYWKIEETVNPRLPVGPTDGFIAESNELYFYIEYHYES